MSALDREGEISVNLRGARKPPPPLGDEVQVRNMRGENRGTNEGNMEMRMQVSHQQVSGIASRRAIPNRTNWAPFDRAQQNQQERQRKAEKGV